MTVSHCALRGAGTTALLLLGFQPLPAADTTFVQTGDRVRLRAPQVGSSQLVGDVTQLTADTLVLSAEGGRSAIRIPTADLERISVSQGKKSNTVLGMIIGAGVGLASAAGLAIWACNADDDGCTSGQVVGGALGLTAVTAGLGAGVGALIKTERWRDATLPPPPPGIGLGVGPDGSVRLTVRIRR